MEELIEQIKKILKIDKLFVLDEKEVNNGTGYQLKVNNGSIINVFKTGKILVQGKKTEEILPLLKSEGLIDQQNNVCSIDNSHKKVFVVYGHDRDARNQLEAMLRRWKLEPLILDQLPNEGQTIIEKLESALSEANFGIVLATPDDEGFRQGRQDEKAFRARQNVVLELGMLLTKLGRRNVAILLKQQENMEKPSDINGLIYIPFKDDIVKDAGVTLAKTMTSTGYKIDVSAL